MGVPNQAESGRIRSPNEVESDFDPGLTLQGLGVAQMHQR